MTTDNLDDNPDQTGQPKPAPQPTPVPVERSEPIEPPDSSSPDQPAQDEFSNDQFPEDESMAGEFDGAEPLMTDLPDSELATIEAAATEAMPAEAVPTEPTTTDLAAPQEPAVATPVVPAAAAAGDDEQEPPDDMPRMTIGEHLEELRKRLFYSVLGLAAAVVLGLIFGRELIELIMYPYRQATQGAGVPSNLKVLEVTGAFTMYLRVGVYAGLLLASPWIFYQLWAFVAAGLYKHERKWVTLAVPFSVVLFLCGAAFAIHLSVPCIKFFVNFGQSFGIVQDTTLPAYVEFMTNLLLAFGIVFQVPLVVLILAKVHVVDMKKLNRYRRHVIVAMAAIAAILAPPDLFSMIAMLLPMLVLYELGVGLAWLLVLRKRQSDPDNEDAGE